MSTESMTLSKAEQKINEMQQQINELTDLCEDYNNEIRQLKEAIFSLMSTVSNNQDTLIRYGDSIVNIQRFLLKGDEQNE